MDSPNPSKTQSTVGTVLSIYTAPRQPGPQCACGMQKYKIMGAGTAAEAFYQSACGIEKGRFGESSLGWKEKTGVKRGNGACGARHTQKRRRVAGCSADSDDGLNRFRVLDGCLWHISEYQNWLEFDFAVGVKQGYRMQTMREYCEQFLAWASNVTCTMLGNLHLGWPPKYLFMLRYYCFAPHCSSY